MILDIRDRRENTYNGEIDEDNISPKEAKRVLDKLARDKGYSNYQELKDDCAKKMGFRDWRVYQRVLIKGYRENHRIYLLFLEAGKLSLSELEKLFFVEKANK